jgi:hypothetical protein
LDSAEAFVPARVAAENGEDLFGRPNILFERGDGVKTGCEKVSLWTSAATLKDEAKLGSSIDWTGPTPIIFIAGFAFFLAIISMVVSSCRRPAKSTSAAKPANKVVPALADYKQKLATLDEESGEGSEERLHWEGYDECNNFVQAGYGEGNNFGRVPSFGTSSNAR